MNSAELSAGLTNLAESDPEAFATLSLALQAHQKAPEGRPKCEKAAVYPRGSLTPVMIWPVDRRGWLAEGATENLADATRIKTGIEAASTEAATKAAEAEAATGGDPEPRCEPDLKELRAKWSVANPGARIPGRAKRDWFIEHLDSE